MRNIPKKEKIAVAMSGGVDSSVSALLLKERGHDVAGFYFRLFEGQKNESLKSAKAVAKKLKIPLRVIDLKKHFKKIVVANFISEYKNLRTPNPCVLCNRFIKFGFYLDVAKKLGYQRIATGHYAQIKRDKKDNFRLISGKDKNKDQSYFLFRLNQKQLSKIIFPVGEMTKEEVWKIAAKNKLPFEKKKESQEICFIQDKGYGDFLRRNLPGKYFESGKIVNPKQEILGIHNGLINYTIGQRKGIDQGEHKNNNKKPLYVSGFDKRKNKLIVGSEEEIYRKSMLIGNVSWISDAAKKKAYKNKGLLAKIRYRHKGTACKGEFKNGKITVNFRQAQRAVAPGQYAVIYHGKEVLGGGKILK
jgi:tRNA-uridine 2-sulfurtransferase